jgi:hypothetical protein
MDLFEHDSKTKKITHNFSDDLVAEENDLKLVVTDNVGNSTTLKPHFSEVKKYNT